MAFTTIDNPELYFQTKIFTGTGSSNAVTLDGDENMQPDMVWIKHRTATYNHVLTDAVRGVTKEIYPNTNGSEVTNANGLTAFGSDGFTVGSDAGYNASSGAIVAWCWKAGGSTSSNTTGDITSTVSVNSTSKFSIVSYTGNGTANQTVGHSLGVKPDLIIIKNRDRSVYWPVINPRFVSTSDPNMLYLNVTDAEADDTNIQGSNAHSSTIFGVDDWAGINTNTEKQIAYCWASVQGFSKFGVYTGNGNDDGPMVYTGFKPALVIVKKTASSPNRGWIVEDNKRGFNGGHKTFKIEAGTDATNDEKDFVSNGFKIRGDDDAINTSGVNYVYLAWAEAPFVNSEGVPCNAR